ncbi:MAG: DUF4278 domain-containing protein [Cyanobacteriota bacterium]|nr:DUF4278 domain-containing protein [Cyanobacteriota bacterium]
MSQSSQLTYRGIAYCSGSKVHLTTATYSFAQFRGLVYNLRRPIHSHQPEAKRLKYRGLKYISAHT